MGIKTLDTDTWNDLDYKDIIGKRVWVCQFVMGVDRLIIKRKVEPMLVEICLNSDYDVTNPRPNMYSVKVHLRNVLKNGELSKNYLELYDTSRHFTQPNSGTPLFYSENLDEVVEKYNQLIDIEVGYVEQDILELNNEIEKLREQKK